jgi:CheY-like chemotaxis protein
VNILIVDDSVSVRKALERLLAPRNFAVTSVSSAEHALESVAQQTPSLVIADIVMPGMNGFELTQRLKASDHHKHIPVLLISGIVDAAVQAQAKEAGAQGVVSKPFTPEELFPRIDEVLSNVPESAPQEHKPEAVPAVTTPSAPVHRTVSFDTQLTPFLEKPEVETVLIVATTVDASVLAYSGKQITDAPLIGTYIRTITSISRGLGMNLNVEEVGGFSIEYGNKSIFVQRLNDTSALALIIGTSSIPSTVRYLAQRQVPVLQQAFA